MSDEQRDPEMGETAAESPPTVGGQLKAAREAKQMSVGDVAMALKLGSKQVEALENGNWQSLPGQTFIRGFVRNYARLLQIDSGPLMGQLDAVLDSPQLRLTLPGGHRKQVAMPRVGHPRRRDSAMVWVGIVLVVLAAAIYFFLPEDLSELRGSLDAVTSLFSRQEEPAPAAAPVPQASQSEPVFPPGTTPQQVMNPQATVPAEAPPAAPSPSLAPPSVMQEPAPQPAPAPRPQEAAPATAAADKAPAEGQLVFSFEKDSWIEVRDRQGKVLFSQVKRAGSEQSVEGQGPFSVVIGNAPGVKLSLRGKPVDLAPRTQGNVARFTLE